MGLSCSVGACGLSGDGGPMIFGFSGEFDCASRAMETLRALSVSLSVSLCKSAETGLGFVFVFLFVCAPKTLFTHAHCIGKTY